MFAIACNWIGAAALCAAPFIIETSFGQGLAVFGLVLLTRQAIANSLWNLVLLNLIGIFGYLFTMVA